MKDAPIFENRVEKDIGLSAKSVYFNSGSVLTQAMIGGNIALSDSGVPEMLVLPVSGAFDTKVITVNINRLVMAYGEGIYAFKTKPKLVYHVLEEEGIWPPERTLHQSGERNGHQLDRGDPQIGIFRKALRPSTQE